MGVMVLRLIGVTYEIKPTIISKLTTFVQLLTIFLVLLHTIFQGQKLLDESFLWFTAVLTAVSGLHYVYKGMILYHRSTGNHPPAA
jgi:cardiolipin synthase